MRVDFGRPLFSSRLLWRFLFTSGERISCSVGIELHSYRGQQYRWWSATQL